MATIDALHEKVGEVWGLAVAASSLTTNVAKLVEDKEVQGTLHAMGHEAEETARRCEKAAGGDDEVASKARETTKKAQGMAKVYLADSDEGLEGLEFMVMAEAGEAAHWEILRALNGKAGDPGIAELVDFALPIQERHYDQAKRAALGVAGQTDPSEEQ